MIPREISIGPLTIHIYGLVIAIAIFLGWVLAKKRAAIYKVPRKLFDDPILIIPLILAISGARIYHIADYWDYYQNNLDQILVIWNGGLGIFGAIAGALLGFWAVAKIKKIDIWKILDLSAPSLLLGQAIGRIANYINQEGFGPPTDKPWGIYINPENRPLQFISSTQFHPTFFYEAAINFIFFIILIILAKKLQRGQSFSLYLIFYASSRFITEFWRIDTWTVGEVKVAHVVAVSVFLIGIWCYLGLSKRRG